MFPPTGDRYTQKMPMRQKQAPCRWGTGPVRFFSCLGEVVFLLVPAQILAEGAAGLDLLQVGVAAGAAVLLLNDAHGDVGAVVGHPLDVGQQVTEHKSQLDGALAGLEPLGVAGPDLLDQQVDGLLQGLHLTGQLGVRRLVAAEVGV